jgi:hypothetical protein
MMPYSWGNDEDEDLSSRDNFKGLLLAISKQSPVAFAPELDCEDDDIAKRFFYASRGTAGELKEQLLETTMRILTRRIRLDSRRSLRAITGIWTGCDRYKYW